MYGIDTPVYVYKAGVSDDLITLRYCRSGNMREILIFANFASWTNSRFKNLAKVIFIKMLLKKLKFENSKLHEKSKTKIPENLNTRKLPDLYSI